jgi:hypothetical protein
MRPLVLERSARRLVIFAIVWAALCALTGCRAPQPAATPAKPLQLVSDSRTREIYGGYVRLLLKGGRFQQLDALADSLQRFDNRFDNGASQLAAFYFYGFRSVNDGADADLWERHLSRLRDWREQDPQSRTADIALAFGLVGRGWAARGGKLAASVSDKGWRGFEGDLEEARGILEASGDGAKSSPAWYEAMLEVLHGLGEDSLFVSTFGEAAARFPEYSRYYMLMSWHLQPRWYGEPGDWERFAAECAPQLPDSLRDEMYARILMYQARYVRNLFQESQGLSWVKAERGCEILEHRWPTSPEGPNLLAYLAWQAGRRDVARQAFSRIGDQVDVDVWRTEDDFLRAKRWAASS